jgi:hypothetical protein
MFALPAMIVFYVLIVRGFFWAVRPALLFVRPKLKGRAFFDHAAHQRTNALSFDVRTPFALVMPRGSACERELGCIQVGCMLQVTIGLIEVCRRSEQLEPKSPG